MRDILLDDNGDLRIENGDFVMGDCQEQNVKTVVCKLTCRMEGTSGSWYRF
ncbi:hypothetical protein E5F92_000420 [Flavobacterium columnare]|uniref:hypothetical protein n=1 Tax=Flavobacterium columnare TaxID=996 RepID=UPI002989E190|nr:hypothetical protein [Flavobacterium columnare]MCH4831222.1 hypothetical protein [Flavobacterium columnare]